MKDFLATCTKLLPSQRSSTTSGRRGPPRQSDLQQEEKHHDGSEAPPSTAQALQLSEAELHARHDVQAVAADLLLATRGRHIPDKLLQRPRRRHRLVSHVQAAKGSGRGVGFQVRVAGRGQRRLDARPGDHQRHGRGAGQDARATLLGPSRMFARMEWRPKKREAELAYVLYNDQDQPRRSHKGGHTKGALVLDESQGFWLIHSTPVFPPARQAGHYQFPSSGATYGQNFLCVTFPLERFGAIGEQLQINQPHVYDCAVPQSFAAILPALAAVCNKSGAHVPAANRSVALTSKGGATFVSFAKGAAFNDDLYTSWVAPALQSDLLVQFWIHSGGVLPSDCSLGWKVLDVTRISPAGSPPFGSGKDHSKWAVSPQPAAAGGGWLCVADINRNRAEEKRGGGALCRRHPAVWKAYRAAALDCQPCQLGGGKRQLHCG
ncbi:deoxyribonuclease-2-alpha isoform X2 [Vanacampus margaritifer]